MPVAETEDIPLGPHDGFTGGEDDAPQEMVAVVPPAPPKPNKPLVGIIYPPPEVRNIVDKTASFVARNGPEFESRIRQNEMNNPKFNFLNSGDPYHAYYQHKVKEIQEGKTAPAQQAVVPEPPGKTISLIDEAKKKKQSELLKQVELPFVPKDPPVEFEFVADPPSISALDLDVVKLTAQFVARNGRQFLSSLMTREQRNYQFDFLRPQHSLFQYFTKLLEQYTKVLIPAKDITKKLSLEDRKKVLDDVKYRSNWIKHQEAQKRKEEEEAERERMAYASIDWHDFVVVETVDYQPFEQGNFPPPTTPQEVGARVLLQDRILQGQPAADASNAVGEEPLSTLDDTEVQDMEEDSSSSEDEDDTLAQPPMPPEPEGDKPPLPPSLEPPRQDKVIIKKDYDPKLMKHPVKEIMRPVPPEEYTISPITGERIPVSKLQEHMRIGLLDPRWKDQRDRQLMEKVNQESVYAPGTAIDESLKQLAERRSDIFGIGVEETPIGKKVGEEERERIPGMPWDPTIGLSSSLTVNAAPPLLPPGGGSGMDDDDMPKKDAIGPSIEPTQPPLPAASQQSSVPPPQQPPLPPPSHHLPPPPGGASNPPAPPGISQPPGGGGPPPSMPPMPGIVRPMPGGIPGMPSGGPPPPPGVQQMFMSAGLGHHQMRPLLGLPQGYPPFPPGPPGTLPNRPPLLQPTPGVPPMPPNLVPPVPPQAQPPPVPAAPPTGPPGVPPPGSGPPPSVPSQQPAPPATSSVPDDEPPAKKAKSLEDSLIPEREFMSTHMSPVTFNVLCQSMPEKPELNLLGQVITVTLPLGDSISVLKQRIHGSIGLAPGKQKLRLTEGLFFKDQNTVAFYNIGDGATVHLSLKERGGRKK